MLLKRISNKKEEENGDLLLKRTPAVFYLEHFGKQEKLKYETFFCWLSGSDQR
jgi:hypothetical protein